MGVVAPSSPGLAIGSKMHTILTAPEASPASPDSSEPGWITAYQVHRQPVIVERVTGGGDGEGMLAGNVQIVQPLLFSERTISGGDTGSKPVAFSHLHQCASPGLKPAIKRTKRRTHRSEVFCRLNDSLESPQGGIHRSR